MKDRLAAQISVTCFGCAVNHNNFFISYSLFHITTCFGLYRPSSGEIYTQSFLKAITPTTDPFLGYTVHYLKFKIVCY
jgi:hypothetical protein